MLDKTSRWSSVYGDSTSLVSHLTLFTINNNFGPFFFFFLVFSGIAQRSFSATIIFLFRVSHNTYLTTKSSFNPLLKKHTHHKNSSFLNIIASNGPQCKALFRVGPTKWGLMRLVFHKKKKKKKKKNQHSILKSLFSHFFPLSLNFLNKNSIKIQKTFLK